jgi:hypothetical protein
MTIQNGAMINSGTHCLSSALVFSVIRPYPNSIGMDNLGRQPAGSDDGQQEGSHRWISLSCVARRHISRDSFLANAAFKGMMGGVCSRRQESQGRVTGFSRMSNGDSGWMVGDSEAIHLAGLKRQTVYMPRRWLLWTRGRIARVTSK